MRSQCTQNSTQVRNNKHKLKVQKDLHQSAVRSVRENANVTDTVKLTIEQIKLFKQSYVF